MNHDPLQAHFDRANEDLAGAAFTQSMVARLDRRRRQLFIIRITAVALLVVLEVLLEAPLQNTSGALVEVLGRDLLPVGEGWLALLVGPLNSFAGLVAILLMGLNFLVRRMVR